MSTDSTDDISGLSILRHLITVAKLARMQFFEIPLYSEVDGQCTCGKEKCDKSGKHPTVFWKDLEEPPYVPEECNVGILTGKRSGVWVLDIDRKNGKDGLTEIEKLGELPDTYTVVTPSGGLHLYFTLPDFAVGNRTGILPGVDVRGEGGLVVGPGSVRGGGTYEVLDAREPVAAPTWLLAMLTEARPSIKDNSPRTVPATDAHVHEAREWLRGAPIAKEKSGGQKTLWTTCRKLTIDFTLDEAVALEMMAEWNGRCEPPWEEKDLVRTLHRAARSQPHHVAPPWWNDMVDDLEHGMNFPQNGEHEFSFLPGRDRPVTQDKPKKMRLVDVAFTLENFPEWAGVLRFDTFAHRHVAIKPPMPLDLTNGEFTQRDVTAIRMWFEYNGHAVTQDDVQRAIDTVCANHKFHPVQEWLKSLPAADPKILDTAAKDVFGAETEIECVAFKRFMVGAVARVMNPGVKFDYILTLQGEQGIRKSTFVQWLFSPWYRDQLPDLSTRDAAMALEGYWGIEIAELHAVTKAEQNRVKEFLSRNEDRYREFGGAGKIKRPRQSVFIGTTNDDEFLTDPTGARRWWTIKVRKDIDLGVYARETLFSAALQLWQDGERIYLNAEEEAAMRGEHQSFTMQDPWHEAIVDILEKENTDFISTADIVTKIVPELKNRDQKAARRVGYVMRRLGWKSAVGKNKNKKSARGWKI